MSEAEALLMALCSIPVTRDSAPPSDLRAGPAIGAGCAGVAAGWGCCSFFPVTALLSGSLGQLDPREANSSVSVNIHIPLEEKALLSLSRQLEWCCVGQGGFFVFVFGFWFFSIPPFVSPLIFFFPPVSFN